MLFVVCCLRFVCCRSLCVASGLLYVVRCMLSVVCCVLFGVCGLMAAVCCLLVDVRGLLGGVCSLVFVHGCLIRAICCVLFADLGAACCLLLSASCWSLRVAICVSCVVCRALCVA